MLWIQVFILTLPNSHYHYRNTSSTHSFVKAQEEHKTQTQKNEVQGSFLPTPSGRSLIWSDAAAPTHTDFAHAHPKPFSTTATQLEAESRRGNFKDFQSRKLMSGLPTVVFSFFVKNLCLSYFHSS